MLAGKMEDSEGIDEGAGSGYRLIAETIPRNSLKDSGQKPCVG